MKKGFSLIFVILIIVLLTSFGFLGIKFARLSQREVKNHLFLEKANLFLKNCIELSLLAISGYNHSKNLNCLQKIKIISKNKNFIADIKIEKYFLSKDEKQICKNSQIIKTDPSNGMVLIKIEVKSNTKKIKNKISITKTTLQKI